MKLAVASMVASGTLPTTSNRSELSQAWTAGNIVWVPKHPWRRPARTANVGTSKRSSFAVHKSSFWQVLDASAEVRPAFGLIRALLLAVILN